MRKRPGTPLEERLFTARWNARWSANPTLVSSGLAIVYGNGVAIAVGCSTPGPKQHLDRATELAPQVRPVWHERAKPICDEDLPEGADLTARKLPALKIRSTQSATLLFARAGLCAVGETELAKKYADLIRETPPLFAGNTVSFIFEKWIADLFC